MKHKVELFRIYLEHHNFTNEDVNRYHYLFHQVSMLIVSELDLRLSRNIESLIITFSTKELLLRDFDIEDLPNIHWYSSNGSADVIFDYETFFSLNFEEQKMKIFLAVCDCVNEIARKAGKRSKEISDAIIAVKELYETEEKLDIKYVAMSKAFEYRQVFYKGQVLFDFNGSENISVLFLIYKDDKVMSSHKIINYQYGYLEWVITAFKKIRIKENILFLEGAKDLECLPFKVDISSLAERSLPE